MSIECIKEVALTSEKTVLDKLEPHFNNYLIFTEKVKHESKALIKNIVDCLKEHQVHDLLTTSPLYKEMFFWFLKFNSQNSYEFQNEGNRRRFNSIYDMEREYPSLTLAERPNFLLKDSKQSK